MKKLSKEMRAFIDKEMEFSNYEVCELMQMCLDEPMNKENIEELKSLLTHLMERLLVDETPEKPLEGALGKITDIQLRTIDPSLMPENTLIGTPTTITRLKEMIAKAGLANESK